MTIFVIKERRVTYVECRIEAETEADAIQSYEMGEVGLSYDEDVTEAKVLSITPE